MKKVQRGIASNCVVASRQLAEVLRLSTEPMLPETKCLAFESLLIPFPKDSATRTQLLAFRDQCARAMILNPLEQLRFVACFDRWMQTNRIINPFISEFLGGSDGLWCSCGGWVRKVLFTHRL
jgi:hypothetical protein